MCGRHVFEVSPSSVGGSLYSIAVGWRGMDVQKVIDLFLPYIFPVIFFYHNQSIIFCNNKTVNHYYG